MADVPGLQFDRLAVQRTEDRDACVRTGSLFRLSRRSGLSDEERAKLKSLTMRRKTAQALALRARIVLTCAEGGQNKEVAAKLVEKLKFEARVI